MDLQENPRTLPEIHGGSRRRMGVVFAAIVAVGLAGGISWWLGLGSYLAQRRQYAHETATFSGSSEPLRRTVVVPTLDTPCPPRRNVVWCSSFQLAWNEVRDNVIGAPLEVVGAEGVAARLNAAQESGSDLEPESYYAAGGWIRDGIREKIKSDMATRFPAHVLPDFNDYRSGILAYSYLTAAAAFRHPFEQTTLVFGDSQAAATEVQAFGVWNLLEQYNKIREQVEILHCRREKEGQPSRRVEECVIDLCKDSKPYQVIVALTQPKGSLAETLEYLRLQVAESRKSVGYERSSRLDLVDKLKVPEMFWKIEHQFQELIGKTVKNVGLPVVEAMETIEFRLDRNGAVVESEARFGIAARPREFIFDRPFLVYMQRRGAERPFFVMWVDNAELLTRR